MHGIKHVRLRSKTHTHLYMITRHLLQSHQTPVTQPVHHGACQLSVWLVGVEVAQSCIS